MKTINRKVHSLLIVVLLFMIVSRLTWIQLRTFDFLETKQLAETFVFTIFSLEDVFYVNLTLLVLSVFLMTLSSRILVGSWTGALIVAALLLSRGHFVAGIGEGVWWVGTQLCLHLWFFYTSYDLSRQSPRTFKRNQVFFWCSFLLSLFLSFVLFFPENLEAIFHGGVLDFHLMASQLLIVTYCAYLLWTFKTRPFTRVDRIILQLVEFMVFAMLCLGIFLNQNYLDLSITLMAFFEPLILSSAALILFDHCNSKFFRLSVQDRKAN